MSTPICRAIAIALTLITLPSGAQTFQTVHAFRADKSQGANPHATLTVGPDGQLYGTTTEGGVNDDGTAFKISLSGTFTLLGHFEETTTGRMSYARLIDIGDGFLYGVTEKNGGVAGDPAGTVFKLDPNGGTLPAGGLSIVRQLPSTGVPNMNSPHCLVSAVAGSFHVLGLRSNTIARVPLDDSPLTIFSLDSSEIGLFPNSMIVGADGKLYGHCEGNGGLGVNTPHVRGTIFRVDVDGNNLTRLHEVPFPAEIGGKPRGGMIQAPDGNFYGTMAEASGGFDGCVFQLTSAGVYTAIHLFDDDLKQPQGDLLLASDGYLYGTTKSSANFYGGVFRIKPDGSGYQVVHEFNQTNGAYPVGGLVQGSDGHLYGTTTESGTTSDVGTIYRIALDLPPPNRAPVALDDSAVTTGDPEIVDVLANDFDPEGDSVIVAIETPPSLGTAVVQNDGTILYTPGDLYVDADEFSYTITDASNGSSTATVRIRSTEPPALVQPGKYNGLLNFDPALSGDDDLPRGQFVINVTATGRFTGLLYTQKKRFKLKGVFASDGTAVVRLKLSKKNPAILFLGFRPDEEGTLLGVLFGQEVWSGGARPLRPSGFEANTSYTIVVASEELSAAPAGIGYGVMQIRPTGTVVIAGKLSDGSKLVWSTNLVSAPNGSVALPVFSEPLNGGVCAGVLSSQVSPGAPFTGAVRWIRPPASRPTKPFATGFDKQVAAFAYQYVAPTTLAGVLDLGGDNAGTASLASGPETVGGTFTFNGKKIATTAPLRALSINRKNGLFKGRIQAGTKLVSFNGVILQPINSGFGYFLLNGTSGVATIQGENVP